MTPFQTQLISVLPHLRAYGRALTGSADQADDLVQDTIVRLLAAQETFKPGTNFRAWAIAILRNRFIDIRRRARYSSESIDDVDTSSFASPALQESAVFFEETAREFWRLNPAHREIMTLIGINGMSYDKAAEMLGCPVGTVRSRLARARAELQTAIEGPRGSAPKAKVRQAPAESQADAELG
jgi:RNA polymerase sigma-70 factor (ECF subfamily)